MAAAARSAGTLVEHEVLEHILEPRPLQTALNIRHPRLLHHRHELFLHVHRHISALHPEHVPHLQQLVDRSLHLQLSAIQNAHAIAHILYVRQLVARQQHRLPRVLQLLDQILHLQRSERIQP